MKLFDSVCNVLKRLDDYPALGSVAVWTRDEIELYLQDGYDAFCRQTKAVFDMFYPENVAQTGNHCGEWEEDYFDSGMIRTGIVNFTGGYWEADYAEAGAIGPRNSTQPWEAEYVAHVFSVSLLDVPEDNVTVERATYDEQHLEPEFTQWFQEEDRDFQTTSGTPSRFAMDKDGMSRMRLVPAGSGSATVADVESGTYGILRDSVGLSPSLLNGLEAEYLLDETSGPRRDSVGDHHLTAENAPSYAAGKKNNAVQLTATSSQALNGGDVLHPDGAFTVCAWVYPDSFVTTHRIVARYNAGVAPEFALGRSIAGTQLVAYSDLTTYATDTGADLSTGAWSFVMGWYDGSRLYVRVNATETAGTAFAGPVMHGTSEFMVGASESAGTSILFWDGRIDFVRVWNRALTSAERDELYTFVRPADVVFGSWGALREIAEHFPMGGQWGLARRMYYDDANVRVEYDRLGKALEEYPYEVPERFAKYVEFYAAAKALERDGPGQDMKLAAHFMGRFQEGVDRMVKRLSENKRSRVSKIGSTGKGPVRPGLARLPWRYGRAMRRGY